MEKFNPAEFYSPPEGAENPFKTVNLMKPPSQGVPNKSQEVNDLEVESLDSQPRKEPQLEVIEHKETLKVGKGQDIQFAANNELQKTFQSQSSL